MNILKTATWVPAEEGLAHRYLYIDGAWRDHVLNALMRPDDAPPVY